MSLIEPSITRGTHGTFPPSSVSFINYTDEQFEAAFHAKKRAALGTEIHLWSAIQITLGQKCQALREMAKSIKTLIFTRNYTDRYGLSDTGVDLLREFSFLPSNVFNTVKQYINDCIVDGMEPEHEFVLSDDFKGTADAFLYDPANKVIRIYDLKTGTGKAHIEQLMIYEALFCITENVNPFDIYSNLRIYQNGEIIEVEPTPNDIAAFADRIRRFKKRVATLRKGGLR